MENNNNSNCPTMQYHNRLTEEQRDKLGLKYIAEGTTIRDSKTGDVSDIVSIEHNGFKAIQQSSLDGFPKSEFFIPFEEIVDKHGRGIIEVGGYENTEPDHKLLILVVKDIMACNIIRDKENAMYEKDGLIEDYIQEKESMDGQIQKLNGILDNEKIEEVELTQEMAKGGIIGEIKASPIGIIKEVRDADGKILKEVYVGDTLYRRNSIYGTYNSQKNDLLYRYDVEKIHMAYGGIIGVVEKPNFYAVDISSPSNPKTCRIPKWAQHAADSIKKGAKVTTCKKSGKWYISSVLVPKDGITSNEAKHFAAEIRDLLDHKKMERGGVMFESGATTWSLDELILFADNTRGLAEARNSIYESLAKRISNGHSDMTIDDIRKRFLPLFIKAKSQYSREIGVDLPLERKDIAEFSNIYAYEFPVWAKEQYADYDKIKSGLSEIYGKKFAEGRRMEEDSDKVAAAKYWDGFTKKDKLHFLLDHADYVYDKPASKLDRKVLTEYKKLSSYSWNKLPKEVQMAIEEHVIMGVYETGGEISGYTPLNEEQAKELIGDDVDSTIKGILVLIDCTDDEDEKAKLREHLKDYKQN